MSNVLRNEYGGLGLISLTSIPGFSHKGNYGKVPVLFKLFPPSRPFSEHPQFAVPYKKVNIKFFLKILKALASNIFHIIF